MTRQGRLRKVHSLEVILLLVVSALCTPLVQVPADIDDFTIEATVSSVRCSAAGDQYYALLHGAEVSSATSAVSIVLSGAHGTATLEHDLSGAPVATSCGFYAVLGVPISAPLDMDCDGIDDVFELDLVFLDPLDPDDAGADADLDGVDNLTEYRQGRDLTAGVVPGTTENVGLRVFAPPPS